MTGNIALILEGGGMRGVYTAGVLDFFMDNSLYFSKIYGVSAGACHASSYISRQRGRAMHTVTEYLHDPRYAGAQSLLKTGDFFGVQMVYHDIPDKLIPFDYEAFAKQDVRFTVAVTNCLSGQAEYMQVNDLRSQMDVIQASSSLPLLSRKVKIGANAYLDGGIADSIPIERSISDGNTKNLIVLTQHSGYQKGPNKLMPAMRLRYIKYPRLVKSIANRHKQYNQALAAAYQQQEQGMALVIQPQQPVEISRLEKDAGKLHALYRLGYEDAEKKWPDIKKFIEE